MSAGVTMPLVDIALALRCYYDELRRQPLTEAEFLACVQTLPPALRAHYLSRGLTHCLTSVPFREYCLDCRGRPRADFLHEHLSADAFARWQANRDFWDTWYEHCEATDFFSQLITSPTPATSSAKAAGFVLLSLSVLASATGLVLPFTKLALPYRPLWITASLVAGEVFFAASLFFLGKQYGQQLKRNVLAWLRRLFCKEHLPQSSPDNLSND